MDYTHTFQELRVWVLRQAGVSDHFQFRELGSEYAEFWDNINEVEFQRGYVPGEYEKPNTPALWQMKLLTDEELLAWKQQFSSFRKEH